MSKFISQFLFALLSTFFLVACNNEDTSPPGSRTTDCFKTKEDSINFVKAVIAKYPEAQGPKLASFIARRDSLGVAPPSPAFAPINWTEIVTYANNYDSVPLIANKKGFFLNTTGLDFLKGNNNYKQIYLRLGKYTNSSTNLTDYTIMIIPLKSDRSVLHKLPGSPMMGSNSNYDFLDPCPKECPSDFDH